MTRPAAKRTKKEGAAFTLSAFGDEIDADLDSQLRLLNELRIGFLELRAAWGTNVLKMDDSVVASVARACRLYGVRVSCIGSPIGKTPITDPMEQTLTDLDRIFQVAEAVGTNRVRLFSFYPPEEGGRRDPDRYLDEAVHRLSRMARAAEQRKMLLLLENERDIVGDTPARCAAILKAVNSPALRFVWDTGNFVHVGVARPTETGWSALGPFTDHVQVKDTRLSDLVIVPAGQGDAQVAELLARLRDVGYRGVLALEPHLALAGRSSGYSGPDGMRVAAAALREVMAGVGCIETPAPTGRESSTGAG